MRRIFSLLTLLSLSSPFIPLQAHAEGAFYLVSAYYSPIEWQDFYLHETFADEIKMNGEGTHTASGQAVRIGVVAAPRDIPFNTRVHTKQTLTIKGTPVNFEFHGTVLDRGGAITSGAKLPRLDVYMGKGQAGLCRAINFGVQTVYIDINNDTSIPDTTNFDNIPSDCKNPHNETVPLASGSTTRVFDPFTMPINAVSPEADVKIVQNLLARLGAYTGPVDGIFDEDFVEAIFQFQKSNGIVQARTDDGSGTYGPKTRAMLKALLSGTLNKTDNTTIVNASATTDTTGTTGTSTTTTISGLSAEGITELQKKLKELGYFKFEPDGILNKRLVDAIYAFQAAKKIVNGEEDPGAGYYGSVTETTLGETYNGYLAKLDSIIALERDLDAAKLARDEVLNKKKLEYADTLKKIPTVKLGQVHSGIRVLQKILKQMGYMTNKDTAIFGSITKAALAKYQLELKVIDSINDPSAGILGDKTREAIAIDLYNRWLKEDKATNAQVDKLQAQLDELKKN